MKYDVIIVGAGPGGIFSAYELVKKNYDRYFVKRIKEIKNFIKL